MTIYVAAWHVKSESGDNYMGQVVLKHKIEEQVLENIITNCPEVDGMLACSDEDTSEMAPEEILHECLLYPEIVWTEINMEDL